MNQQFVHEFMTELDAVPVTDQAFNPWGGFSLDDALPGPSAVEARRDRLRRHLSAPDVKLVIVGEAPGYQGARISGMAFTSEALLMDGAIPRIDPTGRLTTRVKPWSEPSARIIWELLYRNHIADVTVMWNAYPFWPMAPAENGYGNRTPMRAEVLSGQRLLTCLKTWFPTAIFAALGNKATESMGSLGIEHVHCRHPAYGGKPVLEGQIAEIGRRIA